MKLNVWKGDWGLPSVDFECLQTLTLLKIYNVETEIQATNNPFWSSKGRLPIFRDNTIFLDDFMSIKEYLNEKIDSSLSKKQLGEIYAYYNTLQQKLIPALQYIWWIDERNYTELFRKWYAKALPFPLNYVYPGRYERHARRLLEALYPDELDFKVIEIHLISEAEKCITDISMRLGNSEYFFGTQPTSFDAIVYGYLAPLLKAPLLSSGLQNHLKSFPNLVKFIYRITNKYFPNAASEPEKKPTTNSKDKDVENDFPHSTRNKFLAGIFATAAMLGWALLHGFIPVSSIESTSELDEMFEVDDAEDSH